MKKILAWFLILLVATLIVSAIKKANEPTGYLSQKEAESHAKSTGIITVIVYGAAFFICNAVGKNIDERNAYKKAQKKLARQRKEEQKANGTTPDTNKKKVTPLLCAVSGYEDCPICQTRQKIGRKRCLGCNIRLDKTPVSPGPKEKSTNGVDEPAPKTEAASTKTNSTVSIPEAVPQGKTNPPAQSSAPIVRFCRKCGFELIGGSDFCSHCGTKIVVVAQATGSENNEKKNPTIDGLSRNPIDKD